MSATVRHFGINADDLSRAQAFYEAVFGWTIRKSPWDGYLHIDIDGVESAGGLATRRELAPGERTNAFEVTFGVEDIHATLDAVERLGGQVLMRPPRGADSGGRLVGYFLDSEGNICGVARYPGAGAPPPGLSYFAVACDEPRRGKAFYGEVFGWTFEARGFPGFGMISGAGCPAAVHDRKELVDGVRLNAIETTFAVKDIARLVAAVNAHGGRIVIQPHRLEGVGEIGYFEDTEGNVCGFGLYDT